MSRRLDKVSALLQQYAAAAILREYQVAGTTASVLSVDVSPDLKNAIVWVSLYGKQADELRERLLASAPGIIARDILRQGALRSVPRLKLEIDTSAEAAERVSQILNKLKDD